MAHSFVTFEEKDIRVHDLDLAIACVLIVDAAKQNDVRPKIGPRISAMFDEWLDSISHTGPGCIDLKLDEYLSAKEDRGQLISILEHVRTSLSNSPELSAGKLNALLLPTKIVVKSHYSADSVVGVLDAIKTVLT